MAKDTSQISLTDYYRGQRDTAGLRHYAATRSLKGFWAAPIVSQTRYDEERDPRDGTDGASGDKATRTPVKAKFLAAPTMGKRDAVDIEGMTITRFACRKGRG